MMMSRTLSRRRFIATTAAGAASLALGGMPLTLAAGRLKVVNYATYVTDRNKVNASRAEHQVYADALRENGHLLTGGPLLGDDGRPSGVLLVYSAASPQEAESLVLRDPFVQQGAIERYRLDEWIDVDSDADLLAASLVPPDHRATARPTAGAAGDARRTYVGYAKFGADRSRIGVAGPSHRAYAQALKASGQLLMAGRFTGDSGALFIYRARSKEDALALLQKDPYYAQELIESYELSEWRMFGLNASLL
ncbi:MAG TPA: YciI family protein [Pseudoduganella sp.]